MISLNQMRDNPVAVADDLAVIVDIGKLSARGSFRVEDMRVPERKPAQLQKGEDLEARRVIVGDAEQLGI
jgi:hypothetical protein